MVKKVLVFLDNMRNDDVIVLLAEQRFAVAKNSDGTFDIYYVRGDGEIEEVARDCTELEVAKILGVFEKITLLGKGRT